MLTVFETSKSAGEVEKALAEAAARHQFGVLGVHNLRQKMNEKGVAFDRNCVVVEVCNPRQAKQVLDAEIAISTMLPCRISVYEDGGKTKIAMMNPTALIETFGQPGLRSVAEEVERTLLDIMREAADADTALT